jgi:hypothetical protein
MDTCIYILYWDIDYPYIGQSSNFTKRKNSQLAALKRNSHDNYKIQGMYNKYGNPTIEPLTYCSIDELNNLEEQFILEFNSIDNGLNIISGGYSVGKGINNPASIYSEINLIEAFKLLSDSNNSYSYITELTGIPKDTLTKISTGVQHIWLQEKFPELFKIIMSISKDRYKHSASAKAQGKNYRKIMSPTGEIYTVTNTLEFSKTHNIPNGNLCSVLLGKRNSVVGWRGIKE